MNIYQFDTLYRKANTNDKETPVLGLFFASSLLGSIFWERGEFNGAPFKMVLGGRPLYNPQIHGIKIAQKTITTAIRLEKMLLALFTSTNYENIKDIKNIRRGRYVVDFSELNIPLLGNTFNFILKHQNPRISKSWLSPIQERIIAAGNTGSIKAKTKKKSWIDDEQADVAEFDVDIESSIKKKIGGLAPNPNFKYYIPDQLPIHTGNAIIPASAWYDTNYIGNTNNTNKNYPVNEAEVFVQKEEQVLIQHQLQPGEAVTPTSVSSKVLTSKPNRLRPAAPRPAAQGTWPINHHTTRINIRQDIPLHIAVIEMPKNTVSQYGDQDIFKDENGYIRSRAL